MSCQLAVSPRVHFTEYASMNKEGIFPRVLTTLKESKPILLKAAVSVTAPEGIKGTILNRITREAASRPPVSFSFFRSRLFNGLSSF